MYSQVPGLHSPIVNDTQAKMASIRKSFTYNLRRKLIIEQRKICYEVQGKQITALCHSRTQRPACKAIPVGSFCIRLLHTSVDGHCIGVNLALAQIFKVPRIFS